MIVFAGRSFGSFAVAGSAYVMGGREGEERTEGTRAAPRG